LKQFIGAISNTENEVLRARSATLANIAIGNYHQLEHENLNSYEEESDIEREVLKLLQFNIQQFTDLPPNVICSQGLSILHRVGTDALVHVLIRA